MDGGPGLDAGSSDAGSSDGGVCTGGTPATGSGQAEAKITASSPWTSLHSGNFVGISGGTIAVGDQGLYGNVKGSVDVFVWNSCTSAWEEQQLLSSSDTTPYDMYGSSVSLVGDSLAIGANYRGSNVVGSSVGGVYVFQRSGSTWTQAQAISPATGASRFGWSIAQTSSTLAVGSPLGKDPTSTLTYTGIVSVYTLGNNGRWQYQVPLTPAEAAKNDDYGYSLAIDGNTVVSGAPGNYIYGNSSSTHGKAWIFTGSGSSWSQAAYLLASDGANDDWFGKSVAISGTTVIVGAPNAEGVDGDGGIATDSGAAYVFTFDGTNWVEQAKLVAADAAQGDHFGFTVAAVSESHVLVGAQGAGKMYSFTRSGSTWTQDAGVQTACSGTVGYTLSVSGNLAVSAKGGAAWVFDLADPSTTCVQ